MLYGIILATFLCRLASKLFVFNSEQQKMCFDVIIISTSPLNNKRFTSRTKNKLKRNQYYSKQSGAMSLTNNAKFLHLDAKIINIQSSDRSRVDTAYRSHLYRVYQNKSQLCMLSYRRITLFFNAKLTEKFTKLSSNAAFKTLLTSTQEHLVLNLPLNYLQ